MTICDCERGSNGFGMVGRECDCPPGVKKDTEARIVAWLRREALAVRHADSLTGPEWCDALRFAASSIEIGKHEETAGGK